MLDLPSPTTPCPAPGKLFFFLQGIAEFQKEALTFSTSNSTAPGSWGGGFRGQESSCRTLSVPVAVPHLSSLPSLWIKTHCRHCQEKLCFIHHLCKALVSVIQAAAAGVSTDPGALHQPIVFHRAGDGQRHERFIYHQQTPGPSS